MRKIKNKERCGFRGKKRRYAQFRAEYNVFWENFHRKVVEDKREPWRKTDDKMKSLGICYRTKSYKQIQEEVQSEYYPNTLDKRTE